MFKQFSVLFQRTSEPNLGFQLQCLSVVRHIGLYFNRSRRPFCINARCPRFIHHNHLIQNQQPTRTLFLEVSSAISVMKSFANILSFLSVALVAFESVSALPLPALNVALPVNDRVSPNEAAITEPVTGSLNKAETTVSSTNTFDLINEAERSIFLIRPIALDFWRPTF